MSFAAAAMLSGCASQSSVATSAPDEGITASFAAPQARVVEAAVQTIQALGLNNKGVTALGDATAINFSKGANLFSWGEVGRVLVSPVDANASLVAVTSEKRSQLQITGTREAEFAESIFAGIRERL